MKHAIACAVSAICLLGCAGPPRPPTVRREVPAEGLELSLTPATRSYRFSQSVETTVTPTMGAAQAVRAETSGKLEAQSTEGVVELRFTTEAAKVAVGDLLGGGGETRTSDALKGMVGVVQVRPNGEVASEKTLNAEKAGEIGRALGLGTGTFRLIRFKDGPVKKGDTWTESIAMPELMTRQWFGGDKVQAKPLQIKYTVRRLDPEGAVVTMEGQSQMRATAPDGESTSDFKLTGEVHLDWTLGLPSLVRQETELTIRPSFSTTMRLNSRSVEETTIRLP